MPGWLSDMLEGMLESKIDWRKELMAQISPLVKTKQTWAKPAKRSEGADMYYPNRKKEGIIATVAVDTSGSIGKKELMYYAGEIKGIFDSFPPNSVKLTLMLHHTNVYAIEDNIAVDTLGKIKVQSGGTSHMDVFKKCEEKQTKLLICLTDGYSEFPKTPMPGVKTIILTTGGDQSLNYIPANIGQIVQVEILDKE
jgi:predicted metal-dependent peptidase